MQAAVKISFRYIINLSLSLRLSLSLSVTVCVCVHGYTYKDYLGSSQNILIIHCINYMHVRNIDHMCNTFCRIRIEYNVYRLLRK